MAGATGAMNSLLGKLAMLLGEEYAKHKKLQKNVRFLRDELNSINAVLHKYSEMQNPDGQVKAWMEEVRELAYDIEDCIDAFTVRVEHMPHEPSFGIKGLVRKSIGKVKQLASRHDITNEIQELKERALQVKERRKRYKLDDSASMTSAVAIDPRLPVLYAEASGLVGIDGPRDEIVRLLAEEEETSSVQKLKVVSIVGFGGLGKTTLAKQVYDTIKGQFDCTALVTMSQSPNIKKILVDMISQVGGKCDTMDNERQLIDNLRECFKNKRYFIIVDDIWSISAWQNVKCALLENNLSSRVITTTRIIDIAKSCCPSFYDHIYEIKPLSDHDSKRLFFKRIFHSKNSCPPYLEEVSKAILKICGGIPLAILCISSLLASKPDTKDEWELVRNSLGSELEKSPTLEGVKNILLLSYYDLPRHLKTCLLYLSIFPEDYTIARNYLIWMWIAEGFIVEERGKRLDQVGESYFNDLVNRSMIQPIGIQYDGSARYCRVHDLVLSIITSLSSEENFVTILNGDGCSYLPIHIRRLSIQPNNLEDVSMWMSTNNPSHVRSLLAFGPAKHIPNLLNFRALRVLCISSFREPQANPLFIETIGNLFQLRYLFINNPYISELPNQIGNFQYLEVLDIRHCYEIKSLETIGGLRKLVRLHVSTGTKLPDGIGKMQALEELSFVGIPVNSVKFLDGLGQLTKLRELVMLVNLKKMGSDREQYEEHFVSSLHELGRCNLQSLRTRCYCSDDCILNSVVASDCELPRLQQLCINQQNCRGKQFPKWVGMLANLVHLELRGVRMEERDLHILKDISTLHYLELVPHRVPSKRVVLGSQGFECLKELQYRSLYSGMWLQFAPGAMPKLQRLHLKFNPGATKWNYGDFNFGIEYLSDLRHVWAHDCRANDDGVAAVAKACSIHPNRPKVEVIKD